MRQAWPLAPHWCTCSRFTARPLALTEPLVHIRAYLSDWQKDIDESNLHAEVFAGLRPLGSGDNDLDISCPVLER